MTSDLKTISELMLLSLVCPVTRSELKFNTDTNELISEAAALAFPVRSGVPILLVDEARKI